MATIDVVRNNLRNSKLKGKWKNKDDARKALRKLGAITKDVVAELLEEKGGFWVLKDAKDVGTPTAEVAAPKAKGKGTGKKKAAAATGTTKVTVSSLMRDLIRQGLANKDVLTEATKTFPELAGDKFKGYPAWYRRQLRLAGEET